MFGENLNDEHCRALVWRVNKSSRKYLLRLKRRFMRCRKEDPELKRMAYKAVPVDTQWLNDHKIEFEQYPEAFDDCGGAVRVDGLYEKCMPELDTDDALVYVTENTVYFRVNIAGTSAWYEAGMPWEQLEGMFAE